jgi:expansin
MTDPCAGVSCPTGQTCSNGACTCATGMACTDGCFDTQNDQNHCGNCTTKCAADGACVSGACVTPMCNPDTMQRSGKITTYNLATPMVACHYPTSTLPQYYGAMNEYDWNNAGVCGSCVEITNSQNQKKLTVQITDQCPYKGNEQWCKQGSHHIDLNGAAYSALGANNNPSVTWKFVPCTPMGNIKYYFDKAVQQYYLAVTPLNMRNPLAKVEVQAAGKWSALTRNTSNMYELAMGAGVGALTFRLTDIYNHVITDTVTMAADKVVDGTKQFAACP